MIPITFFRSSSFVGWDFCPQSYFLTYNIGYRTPAGKKAALGTAVHKVMECLAWSKKCKQDGLDRFEDHAFGTVFVVDCEPTLLAERSFEWYSSQETHLEWTKQDQKKIRDWSWKAITLQAGRFDPRKRNIIAPEKSFEIEFPFDWARYKYSTHQGLIEGQLRIKGTIDLTTKVSDGVFEVIDFKTGLAKNWSDGSVKDYPKLCNDPQLRIYHYAISKLFPEAKVVLMTIFFMNDTGSFTISFQKEDLVKTEMMIKKQFERIRNTIRPPLNKGWKCKAFCWFGKNNFPGTEKTVCEHFKDELQASSVESVSKKYMLPGHSLGYYEAPG